MKAYPRLLAGAALLLTASPALAQDDYSDPTGWYAGLSAGWTMMDGTAAFTAGARPLNYVGNARVSGALGFKWATGWRLEAEPTWATNDADLAGFHGGTTMAGGLVNGLYDYDIGAHWRVTGGAGIGAIRVSHNITAPSGALYLGRNGTNLAWQLRAGLSYSPS